MEDSTSPGTTRSDRSDAILRALARERGEIEQFLAAQRERLRTARANLTAQVERVARELDLADAKSRQAEGDLAARSRQLDEQAQTLARLKEEIQVAQAAWQAAQDRAAKQQTQLSEQIARQQEQLHERFQGQIQRQQEQLDKRLAELAERQAQIDRAEAKLAQERQAWESVRQQGEDESRRQGDSASKELAALSQELAEATAQREDLQTELAIARQRCQELEHAATVSQSPSPGDEERLRELDTKREKLEGHLDEAREEIAKLRRQLEEASARGGDAGAEDYRRRYAMAMEDLHELKRRNTELEGQLAQSRAGTAAAAGRPQTAGLSWEAQKQRILAALEADLDDENPEDTQSRIKIEEVIQVTQRTIEERDREVAELKQLLESQSSQVGQMAVGAAAFAEIVDQDVIIQEERENLRQRQEELREKLRKAEVEISIERAKIARERVEMEEKIRRLGLDKTAQPADEPEPEKPARGRWLSRLGLKDEKGPAGEGGG